MRGNLSMPGMLGSASRLSTLVRTSGAGRPVAGGAVIELEMPGKVDGTADSDVLELPCAHPEDPNPAVVTIALRAMKKVRCVQRDTFNYASTSIDCSSRLAGAREITWLAHAPRTTICAAMCMARYCIVTAALSIG